MRIHSHTPSPYAFFGLGLFLGVVLDPTLIGVLTTSASSFLSNPDFSLPSSFTLIVVVFLILFPFTPDFREDTALITTLAQSKEPRRSTHIARPILGVTNGVSPLVKRSCGRTLPRAVESGATSSCDRMSAEKTNPTRHPPHRSRVLSTPPLSMEGSASPHVFSWSPSPVTSHPLEDTAIPLSSTGVNHDPDERLAALMSEGTEAMVVPRVRPSMKDVVMLKGRVGAVETMYAAIPVGTRRKYMAVYTIQGVGEVSHEGG